MGLGSWCCLTSLLCVLALCCSDSPCWKGKQVCEVATESVEITVELKVTTEDWKNSSRLMVLMTSYSVSLIKAGKAFLLWLYT